MPRRLRTLAVLLVAIACAAVPPPGGSNPGVFDLQAHQGGRGQSTQESLGAFARALELGVNTLEFDIGITEDHQPVVWHDESIQPDKCTDTGAAFAGDPQYPYVGKLVHELTLAQIRTLDCGSKIATLPEVFALTDSYRAGVRYNIETKVDAEKPTATADPQEFVDVILAAVRSAGKLEYVEVQSFDWRTLPLVRQAEPSIPVVVLWNHNTYDPGSPWLAGIDPVIVGDPLIAAGLVGANIVSPDYSLPVDKPFIDRAHALGYQVIPWTINDADTMRAEIEAGVDGIITDYPALLREVLADFRMALPPAYRRS